MTTRKVGRRKNLGTTEIRNTNKAQKNLLRF
jgi:hypothetical protein